MLVSDLKLILMPYSSGTCFAQNTIEVFSIVLKVKDRNNHNSKSNNLDFRLILVSFSRINPTKQYLHTPKY